MASSRLSAGARGQLSHSPAGFLSSVACLLLVVLPTVSHAQQKAPSGEEASFGRLGCWNCHGKDGEGGKGIPGGPSLTKSPLSLRRFVGSVRLPINMMPPYAPEWAPDIELAIVYQWLGGIEAVRTPPPIAVELKESPEVKAEGEAKGQVQIEITALRVRTVLKSDRPDLASLRYRLTLITNGKAPVANQTLEYRRAGLEEWSKFTTDEHGEALLSPDRRFIVADAREENEARARLRMAVPAVRTAVVIEALDPGKPVALGIGSAILKRQ
jgi:hypothetical protein